MKRTYAQVVWERDVESGDWTSAFAGSTWRAHLGTNSTGKTVAFTLARDGAFVREGKHQLFVSGTLRELARFMTRKTRKA